MELTQEALIEEYGKKTIVAKIAEKYGMSTSIVQYRIKALQEKGILKKRFVMRKSPNKPKAKSNAKGGENQKPLSELLKGVNKLQNEIDVSPIHKEMLIEILHKVIVS